MRVHQRAMDRARAHAARLSPPGDTSLWQSRIATTPGERTHRRYRNTQGHTWDRRQQLPETARVRVASTRWFSCTSDVARADTDRTLRDFGVVEQASRREGGRAGGLR